MSARNPELRVGVVGATGYLGGELIRLLATHPRAAVTAVAGGRSAGQVLGEMRPSLAQGHLGAMKILPADPDQLAEACDLIFLALPHGESGAVAQGLLARGARVIDLGSDFRLQDPAAHRRFYGRPPPASELLDSAVYSLPELTGAIPQGTMLVANPGCFATALALGIVPLVPHLCSSARLSALGITGSSGSGAVPSARVHHSLRCSNVSAYKVFSHQHLGELGQLIERRWGRHVPVDFVPTSGPFVRGIHLTLLVRRSELDTDPLACLRDAYAEQPLVTVRSGPIEMASVVGSCRAVIGVSEEDGALAVMVAIDNLLKGGSGQAIQNMNLLNGWDPLLGLPTMGLWP